MMFYCYKQQSKCGMHDTVLTKSVPWFEGVKGTDPAFKVSEMMQSKPTFPTTLCASHHPMQIHLRHAKSKRCSCVILLFKEDTFEG